jgi:hypothetical protein
MALPPGAAAARGGFGGERYEEAGFQEQVGNQGWLGGGARGPGKWGPSGAVCTQGSHMQVPCCGPLGVGGPR